MVPSRCEALWPPSFPDFYGGAVGQLARKNEGPRTEKAEKPKTKLGNRTPRRL